MVRQLRQNLARCRRVILDEKMDLKTRERWTQLYNNTSPGAQPDLERTTDARLGEKTPRDRRTRKRFLRKPNSMGTAPRDHRQQTTVTNFLTKRLLNAKVVICQGVNRVLFFEPSGLWPFQRHLPNTPRCV